MMDQVHLHLQLLQIHAGRWIRATAARTLLALLLRHAPNLTQYASAESINEMWALLLDGRALHGPAIASQAVQIAEHLCCHGQCAA